LFDRLAPHVGRAGPALAAEAYPVRRHLAEAGRF
jgi:hypothetical protein